MPATSGNPERSDGKRNQSIKKQKVKWKIWYGMVWDMFFIPKHITNASHPIPAVDIKKKIKKKLQAGNGIVSQFLAVI